MPYWLKVSGTREDPLGANWQASDKGVRSFFKQRPTIRRGDRLVLYAAGSPQRFGAGRIYAVVEVSDEPRQSRDKRWPWEASTVLVVAGPLLNACPTLADIEVDPKSVRRQSHIHLSDEQGVQAEELLGMSAMA